MILGALIAGGGARRFGSDKALALLDARPLWRHAADALGAEVDALVACGRTLPGIPSLADRPAPGLGPLGGIAAALAHAAAEGFAAVVTVPCDTPRLPVPLVARLAGAPSASPAACLTAAYLTDCPVIGWWPADLAPVLDAYLAATTDRSLRGWIAHVGARAVDLGAIPNVNRPADLAALRESSPSAHR